MAKIISVVNINNTYKMNKHIKNKNKSKSKSKSKIKNKIRNKIRNKTKKLIGGSNLAVNSEVNYNLFLAKLYKKYNKFNKIDDYYMNLNNNKKKCDECSTKLEVVGKLGKGSSSILLKIKANDDCKTNNLYIIKDTLYSIKICYYPFTCEFKDEIINLITISLLYANNICCNFLKVFGYNIQCKLFQHFIKDEKILIDTELKSYEDINTNIITNMIDGETLEKKNLVSEYKFTLEQLFEIIYSQLCCIEFCKIYPNDNNFGNTMINNNKETTLIKIINKNFYLINYNSVYKIDYQTVSKFDSMEANIGIMIINTLNLYKKFIETDIYYSMYSFFSIKKLAKEYIENLYTLEIFKKLLNSSHNNNKSLKIHNFLEYIPDVNILAQIIS